MNERTRFRSRLGFLILALALLLSAAVVLFGVAPLTKCPLCERRSRAIAGYNSRWYGGCDICGDTGRVPLLHPRSFSPGGDR